MKLFPALWSTFLILWAPQCHTEDNNSDECQEGPTGELIVTGPSVEKHHEKYKVNENFFCHLHPTNTLNCSWSFHTLQNDTQLSVHISICDDEKAVHSWNHLSKENAGGGSWILDKPLNPDIFVILQFNMSLHNNWILYTYHYDRDMIEIPSPPSNIFASLKDGFLLVTWDLPVSQTNNNEGCFSYELDLGSQERIRNVTGKLSYKEWNDPTHTYKVKIRAKINDDCVETQWSDWSHTVTVERELFKSSMLVIVLISLGIPMILLAVLLLVRNQRVSKLLFPTIPRPPSKYIDFLEKNDAPSFFYPAQTPKAEEEITEVEDTQEYIGTKL